ncbi:uncharacterized protein TRIVIDRAFT_210730 [Trichoderma virens Gv29-8]|uniref:RanBD1 domain-containing protein n=1 Tax=Hypocrea virens (strain Gv29-8 / FGSC 10586) TaxID=413071 RepID=G9N9F1_HYPVG|nr:uncharacterized protein TRIVIDRAFT_210730 [Trichoderma virens Gv29-8]EHK16571.1 hypothetical protein TRIVIDRAFT_210730 [Trichoderma virens Gv29-8]
MVTFALPGEYDGADAAGITPKSRPPLPFAKRTYVATPYAKRLGTPATTSRKLLITRDETMNGDTVSSSRNNLFRASAVESPPTSTFSPSLPQTTMKKVFAPGVTPVQNRVYRETIARATPRGLAANSSDKELFNMRISSPPAELTGEVLASKVPKDWNSKGSIYADQFLAHLCPPNLDDEQRRQFFCILDLRRLKYAANEIFTKKSWKLNIMNFAKEFEKSRSIILLRYGLYEFQSVKPSKEVLKRWRREHGLPDPVEEEDEEGVAARALDGTPSKPAAAKKRKADDNLSKETADAAENVVSPVKRRATVRDEADEPTANTPAPTKNKRKATVEEESPAKLQKTPSSSAKSLFEKIANKPAVSPVPVKAAEKNAANGRLSRSVFNNSLKPPANGVSNGNIFGYLSDASSAKNSGIEADAESESESDEEIEESQEAAQSDEPSGAGDASPQTGSNLTPSGSGDNNGGSFNFNFGSGGASAPTGGFNNPFSSGTTSGNAAPAQSSAPAPVFSFGSSTQPGGSGGSGGSGMFQFGSGTGSQPSQASTPLFGGASASSTSAPSFTATGPSSQPSTSMFSFGASQPSSGFNLAPPAGGSSTTGTTGGTPEPSAQLKTNTSAADNNDEEGEKHEQISLTDGAEKDEEVLYEVRAKVLKFVPAGEASESEEKKSKSPWATKGVGSLRLLKHKEANTVRLLLRAEPRGNVAMNRSVLPDLSYKADEKYVKMTTSNDTGDGLETWMIQVKTKDVAKALAEALETHKALNKK